jgi:hypothetical protein
MRGQIGMKKAIPAILIAMVILLAACPTTTAAGSYSKYLSIRPGNAYTFGYTVTPDDQSHQSPMSVDIPITINTIVDIVVNVSCYVTYTATYKVLVDGIPENRARVTTRTLNNTINSTWYVYNATTPWELFFTNNRNNSITPRKVIIPVNASPQMGTGFVEWDASGVLKTAYFRTVIDSVGGCQVTIVNKTGSGGGVPGYSTVLILIVAAIPTALLANKIAKKARRERVD